ncbi:MAG: uroporphyrinogen decarboxylase family protein [Eubacteriales bacterium]|nr:uroporphyrinogen decarboxylase family protein [Eubacteriales bacterium]
MGPVGFIMSQGCAMPPNAKPENIKAIVDATVGK